MATTQIQRNVTQVLRTLLLAYGEDQSDVARAIGVTQAAVSNKMAGKSRWSLDDIEALAEHFAVEDAGIFLGDPRRLLAVSRGTRGNPGEYRGDVGAMSQYPDSDVAIMSAA